MKLSHLFGWVLAVALLLVTFRAFPAGAKYEVSEVQKLRLQVKQKDAQLAQQALSIQQQVFQQKVADFNAEIKAVEKENGWPYTLQFDPNTLEFADAPAPTPAKSETK